MQLTQLIFAGGSQPIPQLQQADRLVYTKNQQILEEQNCRSRRSSGLEAL